uniref:Uncharacterized protein n=1 Tax=Ditylenchus dipsaci TaxID=166011 RepID=A0A915D1L0_9BILA
MKVKMMVAGSLLLTQGFLGWYMVKSGLDPSKNSNTDIPRITLICLTAFVLYSLFFSTGLSNVLKPYDHSHLAKIGKLRGMTHGNKLLVFTTAVMGAFVAGLDAA